MASVNVRVRVRQRGVQEMLGATFMVQEIDRRARRVKRFGIFTSPYLTGEYSRSWRVLSGTRRGAAYSRVENTAPHAWFVERGTRNADGSVRMAARHVVKRALSAASD